MIVQTVDRWYNLCILSVCIYVLCNNILHVYFLSTTNVNFSLFSSWKLLTLSNFVIDSDQTGLKRNGLYWYRNCKRHLQTLKNICYHFTREIPHLKSFKFTFRLTFQVKTSLKAILKFVINGAHPRPPKAELVK